MAGCYGSHPEDVYYERMLDEYLDPIEEINPIDIESSDEYWRWKEDMASFYEIEKSEEENEN